MADVLKWIFVGLLVVSGVSLNYMYSDQLQVFMRAVMVVGTCVVALVVAFTTSLGKQLFAFMQSSRTELKKVVWPTRQETIQISIIVVIMVAIMSMILWGFDLVLFKLMAWFTGQGV